MDNNNQIMAALAEISARLLTIESKLDIFSSSSNTEPKIVSKAKLGKDKCSSSINNDLSEAPVETKKTSYNKRNYFRTLFKEVGEKGNKKGITTITNLLRESKISEKELTNFLNLSTKPDGPEECYKFISTIECGETFFTILKTYHNSDDDTKSRITKKPKKPSSDEDEKEKSEDEIEVKKIKKSKKVDKKKVISSDEDNDDDDDDD